MITHKHRIEVTAATVLPRGHQKLDILGHPDDGRIPRYSYITAKLLAEWLRARGDNARAYMGVVTITTEQDDPPEPREPWPMSPFWTKEHDDDDD